MGETKKYISPDERDYKDFDKGTKDMLCRIYKFIERNKGSIVGVDFTEHGVSVSYIKLHSCGIAGDGFCKRFIDNLDKIKEIVELQPTTKAVFYSERFIKNFNTNEKYPYCEFDYKSYESYDSKEVDYKIKNKLQFRHHQHSSVVLSS